MADAEGNEPPAPVAEITQALFDQVMAIVDQNDAVIEERSITQDYFDRVMRIVDENPVVRAERAMEARLARLHRQLARGRDEETEMVQGPRQRRRTQRPNYHAGRGGFVVHLQNTNGTN